MKELTSFQRDIVIVIAGLGSPHGLAVKEEISNHYDETINHGRLYPAMDQLDEAGIIEKSKRDERSNTYEITEKGLRMLAAQYDWQRSQFKPDANLMNAVQSD